MSGCVHVRAPSRLHFGMFSFGQPDRPQFGGVGVMIEPPAVDVTIAPAPAFAARGDHVERVQRFVSFVVTNWQLDAQPPCEIAVNAPPDHVGLGVGTQLGLAVASGLRSFLQLPPLAIEKLAKSVGRGTRSAVGTYGFEQGGLIVDGGKHSPVELGQLVCRREVPESWRFVLVRRRAGGGGLAGSREAEAFARLPPVPPEVTDELWRIVDEEMSPALEHRDCGAFGDSVYRFGRLAGNCFAAVQGGPYANPETDTLVQAIRDFGVPGVGQSSWGPTVFAITPSEGAARALVEWLRGQSSEQESEIEIARSNNTGAQIKAL